MKTKIKVEDFFREWTGTRPNLNTAFHEAGIEAMAFAEAYHKAETKANGAEQSASTCNLQNVMPRISHKDCDCSELKHKIDRDQFPYGDDIEYDECPKCGARYNLHCL